MYLHTNNSENKNYLKTMGDGTQNLMSVFLIFSWRVVSSKHQVVCSLADGPAVGSKSRKQKHLQGIFSHLTKERI